VASGVRANELIVGIDLGTTNSLVAVFEEAGPRVLEGEDGGAIVPSVVRYERGADGTARAIVGRDARTRAQEFPLSTVTSVKRLMGRSLSDVARDLPYLPYRVVEGARATARVAIPLDGGEDLIVSPQEVSAEILRELKRRASAALGVEVRKAVVTVPAYFDDAQRQATRDAGRLAGLEVVRIVNEPTAAALAYGLGASLKESRGESPRHVVVYDLGGGTFDVSVLRITPGAEQSPGADSDADDKLDQMSFFQVLATAGDTRLGGDDVDHMLVSLFMREIDEQFGLGLEGPSEEGPGIGALPPETRRALKSFAEAIKHKLSEEERAAVRIDVGEGRVYERMIARSELEALIASWVDRTIASCERALRDAERSLAGADLDAVVLVGGSTRIPLVRRRVAETFGLEPYTALDPDLVVAMGAAVQAGVLSGAARGALLLDVIPLSLGIETVGGAMAKLIVRNTTAPARATEMFSTSVDGQTSIKLNVLQGEREMAEHCRSLGEFHLRGIPPMPAGIPQVEVEFLVDANGVLNVSAVERRSGKRAELQVIPNHGLTRDEVDRMESESVEHARDDMTRHRVTDLIANASLDVKWISERLERFEGELEDEYARDLRAQIRQLQGTIAKAESDWRSVDANEFYAAKEALAQASVRLQEVSIASSLRDDPSR